MRQHGVHSEVGKLRTVIVHRPGIEMRRLTPTNASDLLFDQVIWNLHARRFGPNCHVEMVIAWRG